jgi:hypothetical protein
VKDVEWKQLTPDEFRRLGREALREYRSQRMAMIDREFGLAKTMRAFNPKVGEFASSEPKSYEELFRGRRRRS